MLEPFPYTTSDLGKELEWTQYKAKHGSRFSHRDEPPRNEDGQQRQRRQRRRMQQVRRVTEAWCEAPLASMQREGLSAARLESGYWSVTGGNGHEL
eukprot:1098938-Rhodomonas_salina.1